MRKSNKTELSCLKCGGVFLRTPSQIKQGRSKYCSLKCANDSFTKPFTFVCKFCKKEVTKTGKDKRHASYCSPKCFAGGKEPSGSFCYKKTGERYTHIVVAEKYLGRPLVKGEVVHHIDENKLNNDYTNLAVLPNASIHHQVHYSGYNFDKYKLINLIQQPA